MNKQKLKTIYSMNPTNDELMQLFGFVREKKDYDLAHSDHFKQSSYDIIFYDLSQLMYLRGNVKKAEHYKSYIENKNLRNSNI
jgi:hypothetical protein